MINDYLIYVCEIFDMITIYLEDSKADTEFIFWQIF